MYCLLLAVISNFHSVYTSDAVLFLGVPPSVTFFIVLIIYFLQNKMVKSDKCHVTFCVSNLSVTLPRHNYQVTPSLFYLHCLKNLGIIYYKFLEYAQC